MDVPARRVPCVLGARHVAVSKGVGARRFTKDSRKGSLPDPRNAAQRSLGGIEGVEAELVAPPVQKNTANLSHCARFAFHSRFKIYVFKILGLFIYYNLDFRHLKHVFSGFNPLKYGFSTPTEIGKTA